MHKFRLNIKMKSPENAAAYCLVVCRYIFVLCCVCAVCVYVCGALNNMRFVGNLLCR